jgi:hypothetical protein
VVAAGNAAEVAVLEAVAVALEGDDFGVVDEPVDHGGGDDLVAEDLAPAAERLVAGDDERGAFVAAADELEEQVRGLGLERDVADLVDDQQRVAAQPSQLVLQPAGVVGVGQAGDPLGCGREQHPMAGLAGPDRQAGRPGGSCRCRAGPSSSTLSLAVTKSSVPRWAIRSRLRPRAWSKSNSSRLLRPGKRAARMRPSPPWLSRADTSRCRQATRNSSWVQARPGPLDQPRHGLPQRRGFQRPGQERDLAVRSRPAAEVVVDLAAIRPPAIGAGGQVGCRGMSRPRAGVRSQKAAQLDLRLDRVARAGGMRGAQDTGGIEVGRVVVL